MNKTKIAYVVNDLLVGGAQKLVLDLAKQIPKDKFDVTVYYLYDYEGKKVTLKKNFEEIGAKLVCLETLANSESFISLILACKKEFTVNKPDLVHIHLPNSHIVAGTASILTRTPFIIHEHNTHNFHSWKIKLVFLLMRPFAKLTICYAETVEKETFKTSTVMQKPEDFKGQKIITVLNGIDVTGLTQNRKKFAEGGDAWKEKRKSIGVGEGDIVIFSAARFVKWKGHHLLVEGFAKLLKVLEAKPLSTGEGMGVRLVIAGEGPEKENCEKMAKEFGIADKVKFLGGRTDVGELLAISDIYSLVFDYDRNMGDAEAIGIAGFEGMAAGLPTLIGDFGGANFYMKNWENGVIVKKWDTDDLANCLAKLVNDKSLRSQIGQNATKRIFELLDWSGIIKIYEAIYDKV